jgi:hypothetical protein
VAGVLPAQHRQGGMQQMVGAEEVDVHDVMHLVGRDRVDCAIETVACVAHHDVESAVVVDRALDESGHVSGAGHIGDDRQCPTAGLFDLAGDRLQTVVAPGADRDRGAIARQPECCCAADAGRRAGNRHYTFH